MELDGICAQGYGVGGLISNCCSIGSLSVINGTSSNSVSPIWRGGGSHIHKNNYYLSGIQGIYTVKKIEGDNVFYKTSENEEDMTTAKVVKALNDYIAHPDEDIDTKGWCKWVENEDHLPVLDFNYEWDPTAGTDGTGDFVRVTN